MKGRTHAREQRKTWPDFRRRSRWGRGVRGTYIKWHELHPLVLQLAQVEREIEVVFGRHGGDEWGKDLAGTRARRWPRDGQDRVDGRLVALSEEPILSLCRGLQ